MARPREFDERAVVDAAMHVFWQQGYKATSVDDLVEATGLKRGSLYGAFGDKHGLLLEALDAYGQMPLHRLDDLLTESEDPVDALRGFIRMAGHDCQDETMGRRGCLVGNTCNELAAHDDTARERVDGFVTRLRLVMADTLRRGQAMGTFDPDRDPDAVAAFVQCGLQGLALLAKTRPDPDVIDAVVDELVGVLDQSRARTSPATSDPRMPNTPEKRQIR